MTGTADTVVVGAGVVGLSIARATAKRGRKILVVSEHRPGEASRAAAGMLAPSVEQSGGPAREFGIAARDLYPALLESLADETGIRVPLNRLGILQVALTEKGVRGLRKTAAAGSLWLDRKELSDLEPTLGHALGAVLNPHDGAVDNVVLMSALEAYADLDPLISRREGVVVSISERAGIASATLASGDVLHAQDVVLAPGSWGASIAGAPGLADISPCRGQLMSFTSIGLRHVAYGPRGYLVPRTSGTTIAGSTMENAGFDPETTPEGIAKVRSAAEEIAPGLAVSKIMAEWAGLRPVTPDMHPIIGRDPDTPQFVYACGHSRNGILLAGLTGDCVAMILAGETPAYDLTQFRPGRFETRFPRTHE